MEYPDVIDLTDYWADFPPVHVALRGIVRPAGRPAPGPAKPTDTEQRLVAGSNVKPFKETPAHILRVLQERKKASGI